MSDSSYLERTLGRLAKDALLDAQKAVMQVQADATMRGALGNSRIYILYDEAVGNIIKSCLDRMTKTAFSVAGDTSEKAAEALRKAATQLVIGVTDWLGAKYGKESAAFGFSGPPIGGLKSTLSEMVENAVDDFRNGMLGDTPLRKDPLVSVVNTITNSPNAIQQTAIGDDNQLSIQQQATMLLEAIDRLLQSPDIAALEEQKRFALEDTADTLRNEITSSTPNIPKVKRWTQRLGELAREFGMHAAAAAFAKAALSAFGIHL